MSGMVGKNLDREFLRRLRRQKELNDEYNF